VFELVKSGGWLMVPILLCSVFSVTIVLERLWFLRRSRIAPDYLLGQVQQLVERKELSQERIALVNKNSPLGRILAVALLNLGRDREVMKDAIQESGRVVIHELQRYLNSLGTIAAISPLIGLLGTVIGMIKVFAVISTVGVGDPAALSDGISQALITTAAGLSVGIPSLMFHRYFSGRVNELTVSMEQSAIHLVEFIHGIEEITSPKNQAG